MSPSLPERLRSVRSLIPPGCGAVADIGAGHGRLAAGLVQRGCTRVFATELAGGPLAELTRNLVAWNIDEYVNVRCGAGLLPFQPGEVELAVVAGVGAHTALRIAAEAPSRGVLLMVMQCMQRDELIEPWLASHGWPVHVRRSCVQRGRHYTARLVSVAT